MINPLYSLAGTLVGVLVGLTGVGGGSLMTPLLVLLFGFHPATAVGTDLLYASATKTVGTLVHGRHGTVDWRVVRRLATGSVPAALVTLAALWLFNWQGEAMGKVITGALGVALIATAISVFFRKTIVARLSPLLVGANADRLDQITILLGVVLGVMVSLTSVGAGALGMTALLVLYPKVPVARLVGSDIAHAVPLTLIAGIGHLAMGSVDLWLLASLLLGSIPGIIIGSMLAARIHEHILVPILAITLALVGIRLLA